MTRRDDTIQIVDAVESCAETVGAGCTGRLNLGLRHSVRNTDGGTPQLLKQAGESCGVSVEKPGKGQEALALNICAAKARNVSGNTFTELVVKDAKAGIHNGFCSDGPGSADARGEISFIRELGIVVPAQTAIEGNLRSDFPIVLNIQAVVVVANVDQVILGRWSGLERDQVDPGIDRAKRIE